MSENCSASANRVESLKDKKESWPVRFRLAEPIDDRKGHSMDAELIETTKTMVGILMTKHDYQGALSVLEALEDHLFIDDYNDLVDLVLRKKQSPIYFNGSIV